MGRIIFVPQYPAKLRYQEWWYDEFIHHLTEAFEEVIVLGNHKEGPISHNEEFSPLGLAMSYEASQINDYINLELQPDDVLLLNDISFPGLFTQVLLLKRPKYCYAICHATSMNKYDYFEPIRNIKWPIENAVSNLFETIFVASNYHALKLGWGNTIVWPFPDPPFKVEHNELQKNKLVVSASRICLQKRTPRLEAEIEKQFRLKIVTADCKNWYEYYRFLAESNVLLITAKEETYGYQIIDAVKNGCIPIAPNALSYPELLPKEYLYNDVPEMKEIVLAALTGNLPVPELLIKNRAKNFFKILINEIKNNA